MHFNIAKSIFTINKNIDVSATQMPRLRVFASLARRNTENTAVSATQTVDGGLGRARPGSSGLSAFGLFGSQSTVNVSAAQTIKNTASTDVSAAQVLKNAADTDVSASQALTSPQNTDASAT